MKGGDILDFEKGGNLTKGGGGGVDLKKGGYDPPYQPCTASKVTISPYGFTFFIFILDWDGGYYPSMLNILPEM